MALSDHDFYRARARDEREQALAAGSECARRVHLELAHLYDQRLKQDGPGAAVESGRRQSG